MKYLAIFFILFIVFYNPNKDDSSISPYKYDNELALINLVRPALKINTFIPYKKEIYYSYYNKLMDYRKNYIREAKARNMFIQDPFNFSFSLNNKFSNKSFNGYCDRKNKVIFLKVDFEEHTFFHELGHCIHHYSHKEDPSVARLGYTDELMNWDFDTYFWRFEKNQVLDKFFNQTRYPHVDSFKGKLSHTYMDIHRAKFDANNRIKK